MRWISISTEAQVDDIRAKSQDKPQIIFKHSTRCSISFAAQARLDKEIRLLQQSSDVYILDLLAHRVVSNYIAESFQVHHESPQVLLIDKGECIREWSHLEIEPSDILQSIPTTP